MAYENQKKQADRLVQNSIDSFPVLRRGDNVAIAIPELDRTRLSARNLLGVILKKPKHGLYYVGTKKGILKRWIVRQHLVKLDFIELKQCDVPTKKLSIRGATALHEGRKMGHERCSCVKGCKTATCSCVKGKKVCGSRCHPKISCTNK